MKQELLYVTMFGEFSIEYNGKYIKLPIDIHSITAQMLIQLWDAGDKGISRKMLIDRIYGDNEIDDPANSMRVNIYRLRKIIKKLGLPQWEYIQSKHGIYLWAEGPVRLKTDVMMFTDYLYQSKTTTNKKKQNAGLEQACMLYMGEFLPALASEHWAAIRAVGLKKMYIDAVSRLYKNHMEEHEYDKAVIVADRALKLYFYDSIAVMKIDALLALGYAQQALNVLKEISRTLFRDYGVVPSNELMLRYEAISSRIGSSWEAIKNIRAEIKDEHAPGPYYCSFPSFVDCYKILNRLSKKNGHSFSITCVLLRLVGKKEDEYNYYLIKAVESELKSCDIYTQSNDTQFYILLSNMTPENCYLVIERINKHFQKLAKTKEVKLDFNIILEE